MDGPEGKDEESLWPPHEYHSSLSANTCIHILLSSSCTESWISPSTNTQFHSISHVPGVRKKKIFPLISLFSFTSFTDCCTDLLFRCFLALSVWSCNLDQEEREQVERREKRPEESINEDKWQENGFSAVERCQPVSPYRVSHFRNCSAQYMPDSSLTDYRHYYYECTTNN